MNNLHVAKPIALGRPRGAHQFEAFSPKLARSVIFYRRESLEQWLLLDENANVITFCKRPGYGLINARYVDRDE
ncbi:conserved hypothetical protein [Paraburkholderia ribeironis]|uniref:Uncharacterized protein n=1 Tax=Paraburkholderia ribeironis TaxID=1247936 RepID=A0A1N7RUI6_9BURK|nr:hypothetical protein [Paraburkholderia ribeironis]SIT38795.1 conserved hypothetical protein [Paraburkholderia ribeironis]